MRAAKKAGDFAVDEEAVPEALPEVPEEAGVAVEKAEFQEIADAEIGPAAARSLRRMRRK